MSKNRMVNIVPPPPPTAPSILASNVDQDAEIIANELMGGSMESTAQPDADAEKIADELMGLNNTPKPAKISDNKKSAPIKMEQAPAPQKISAFTQKVAPAGAAKKPAIPAPDPMTTYLGGMGNAVMGGIKDFYSPIGKALQQADQGLGKIRQNPVVGPMFNHMAEMSQKEGLERRTDPLGSIGATLGVGIPRGLLGLGEDVGNIVARTTGNGAPFNLRGLIDSLPGAKQIQQQFPGSVAGGETAAASAVPASAPLKFIANPMVRHVAQGALAGEVLGAVGSGGQQAKTGPVDFGKAAMEGLPTAALGGALGGVGGAIGKAGAAFKGVNKAKPPEVKPAETLTMADGSTYTPQEAIRVIQDATTPKAAKEELQQLLASKDQEIVGLGSKRKSSAKPVARPTVFDDMPANPTPKELNERIAQEIEKATDRDAIDTIENDAIKRINSSIKMKPLQTQALNELTASANRRRAELSPVATPESSKVPNIPFKEPEVKAPVPPANFMQSRAAKLRDKIPAKGEYEIPDPAGAQERILAAKAAYEAEIAQVQKNEKPAIEWPDSQPDIPPVNFRDHLPKPEPVIESRKDVKFQPSEVVEEVAPPTKEELREREESRLFPGSMKTFGKLKEGGYYTAKELNDRQLNEQITSLQNLIDYSKRTPGKRMPSGVQDELKAMVGEQLRREQRKVLGLESDWIQEDHLTTEQPAAPTEEVAPVVAEPLQGKVEKTEVIPEKPKSNLPEKLEEMTVDELTAVDDSAFTREEQQQLADRLMKRMDLELREIEAQDLAKQQQPAEPIGNRFAVEKTAAGSKIVDTSTGETIFDNKQSLAQNAARAEQLNSIAHDEFALEKELRKGSRDSLGIKKGEPGIRDMVLKSGQPIPEGHRLTEPLQKVADKKHVHDEARAEFFAAVDAYDALTNTKSPVKIGRSPIFSDQVEALTKEALEQGSNELNIEVQNEANIQPKEGAKFKRGTSEPEAFARVKELSDKYQQAKREFSEARAAVKDDFLSSYHELGQSVNIPHAKGIINIRAVPRQGTELNARADQIRGPLPEKTEIDRTITDVKTRHKELAEQYEDAANSTERTPRRRTRGRNQKGMVSINLERKENTKRGTTTAKRVEDPTAVSLAVGAEKSPEISDLANNFEKVKNLVTTKNSFDILKDVGDITLDGESYNLHNEVWRTVAKEAVLARKAKFDTNTNPALIEETLRMSPEEIREGGPDGILLDKFTPEQINFLATRKALRSEASSILRESAASIKDEYGTIQQMPNKVRTQYEVMQQLAEAFAPKGTPEGTNEFALLKGARSFLYDYIFKWNPAYHSLNLLDPFILGSSRVGIQNIMRAKALLQDPLVKEYISAVPNKDVIHQLREESAIANAPPKGVKETEIGKGFRKLSEFKDSLPDLPSERWNFEDAFMAGAIMHGDRIYGQGRGAEYVKDIASGKLGVQEEIEMMMESLGVSDDLTGAGSLGVNKNPFQRVGFANSFAQFVSQPIRITRLLRQYANEGNVKALLTFAAANIAFGGRALLPQEVDVLKAIPQLKPVIEGLEDFLDMGNVAKNTPIIGRDLTEKLRYSALIPFAGGISTPLVTDFALKFMKDWEGEKWNHIAKSSFLLGLVGVLGGGGAEGNRIMSNIEGLMKGDKDINVYSKSGKPKGSGSFSSITGEKFDMGNAIKESLLPGDNPRVGAFKKSALRK